MKRWIPFLTLLAVLTGPDLAAAREFPVEPIPDTLEFVPTSPDSGDVYASIPEAGERHEWMRAPIGDGLLTDRDEWRSVGARYHGWSLHGDYNRVDRVRLGVGYQIQVENPMAPRLAARFEYAFGRDRTFYGLQVEQPVIPPGRISVGGSMVRRTDHSELHQVANDENTLALLLARQDYRDYWEREGMGAYVAWRVPDFSNVSIHVRRDEYRTLVEDQGVYSMFHQSWVLRPNPAIDEGESRTVALMLERGAYTTPYTHAGLYHWVEAERAGAGLGGDYTYTRLLADIRGVLRLSPATTLMLRGAAGYTPSGTLPGQKEFPLGGVDALRAHPFASLRGNQLALAQAEYVIGLWKLRTGAFEGGLHAIVFVDVGTAWFDPEHRWSVADQSFAADGGVGLAAAEDKLRVYFAKSLQHGDSDFVIHARLRRPF